MLLLALASAAPSFLTEPPPVVHGTPSYGYGIVVEGQGPVVIDASVLPAWLELRHELAWTSATLAGGGDPAFDGGPGSTGFVDGIGDQARFKNMYGLAVGLDGQVYIADTHNHAIRQLDPDTGEVSTLVGTGTPGFADGIGTSAELWFPQGIAAHPDGFLYVADAFNHAIRRLDPQTAELTTLTGGLGPGMLDGDAALALLRFPKGLCVGPDEALYVSDTDNHSMRRVTLDGEVSTLVGTGLRGYVDGTRDRAMLAHPRGCDFGPDGMLYVADGSNHAIRRIDVAQREVTTWVGTGFNGNLDGDPSSAQLFHPFDVAFDDTGAAFVADSSNHQIRRIATDGWVETIAGAGTPGYVEGLGSIARLYYPRAVDTGLDCDLFVSDRTNGAVRRLLRTDAQLVGTATDDDLGLHDVRVLAEDDIGVAALEASIDVRGFNRQPSISGAAPLLVMEGEPYAFTPAASDPDGDPLAFQVFMLPDWAQFDPDSGAIWGTPGFDDSRRWVHVAITVDDGTGTDNATATLAPFNVLVGHVNQPPAILGSPEPVHEGELLEFTPQVVDADDDPVALAVVGLPSWATFDPDTGAVSGTPGFTDARVTPFRLEASDGVDTTVVDLTLVVHDLNRPPTIDGQPSLGVAEGEPYTFAPTAADPDIDNTLEFSGTGLATWMDLDPTTGVISGTPGFEASGSTDPIALSVRDGRGGEATLPAFVVEVTDTDRAPEAHPPAPATLEVAQPFAVDIGEACVDPDGDPVTYAIHAPSWVLYEAGALVGTPPYGEHGTHRVDLTGTAGAFEVDCGPQILEVVDTRNPSATLIDGPAETSGAFTLVLEASEPTAPLAVSDFVVRGGAVDTVSQDGLRYTVIGTAVEALEIALPEGTLRDLAGNPGSPWTLELPFTARTPPSDDGDPPEERGCRVVPASSFALLFAPLVLARRRC